MSFKYPEVVAAYLNKRYEEDNNFHPEIEFMAQRPGKFVSKTNNALAVKSAVELLDKAVYSHDYEGKDEHFQEMDRAYRHLQVCLLWGKYCLDLRKARIDYDIDKLAGKYDVLLLPKTKKLDDF